MAKSKKLPSGSWRVQVFSHKENGKRIYKSFTAKTKAEAEMLGAEYKAGKRRIEIDDVTVKEAIDGYIRIKEPVLSPSTVNGYKKMLHHYEQINNKRINTLTSKDMQEFVSSLSLKVSPKTVRNVYALLKCSVGLYAPDMTFKVTLPVRQKKRPVSPSDDAVRALYNAASEQMKICILLGMRGIRRGEICALKYEDITDGIAHIHADMVKNSDGEWIYKEIPKTSESDRFIPVPIGKGSGFVVKWTPDSVTKRFIELRDSLGLDIRFHDLRHYFASTAAVLGIPDIYTADLGGWTRDGSVMKSVYQNNIKSMSDYYADKIEKHLQSVTS